MSIQTPLLPHRKPFNQMRLQQTVKHPTATECGFDHAPLQAPSVAAVLPSASALTALAAYNRPQLNARPVGIQFRGERVYPFVEGDIRLGNHADTPYLNTLYNWQKKIWHEATQPRPGFPKGWLNPMDTIFQVSNQIDLMEAAARSGFPSRYRHWGWGQDFNESYQRQRFGLGRLYEMVINTKPSYAFLYDRNPVYAQKVVMAHVLGHTDFFRNNIMYSETDRNMVRTMADNKAAIEKYYQNPALSRKTVDGVHPVEAFINQVYALEWLVNMDALSAPPLKGEQSPGVQKEDPFKSVGLQSDDLGVAPWMQDFLYPMQRWELYRDSRIQHADQQNAKIVKQPDRDVMGFLLDHAPNLESWQKDILGRLRKESYYFVPQVRTKLMNEGWATFWHHKLMADCAPLVDPSETADISKMMAGVEAPPQSGINPYQLGYAMFRNIYNHAAYGLNDFDTTFSPNKTNRYEDLHQRMEHQKPNEEAGLKKVLDVRANENDVEFIRKYFTQEVAQELGLVQTKQREEWDADARRKVMVKYVESDDFKQVRAMVLSQYANTFPAISIVDANHNNAGELRLQHENTVQDLNLADTQQTLITLNQFWGRPVNLDTIFEVEEDKRASSPKPWDYNFFNVPREPEVAHKRQPVRLTCKDGAISIHTLNNQGKPEKDITNRYF